MRRRHCARWKPPRRSPSSNTSAKSAIPSELRLLRMRLHRVPHLLHGTQVGVDGAEIVARETAERQPRHHRELLGTGRLRRTVLRVFAIVVELLDEKFLAPLADPGLEV